MRMSSAMNVPVRPTPALERREREGGMKKEGEGEWEGEKEGGIKEGEGGKEGGKKGRRGVRERERNENDNGASKKLAFTFEHKA